MATVSVKTKDEEKTPMEVATRSAQAVTMVEPDDEFGADAGAGLEGATQDSFAIPFLMVLQKGSPQVDETAGGVVIDGAKSGMLYENVTGRLYGGQDGVSIIPCAYRRTFLRWGARGTPGAGFKGELTADEVDSMRAKGEIKELDGRLYVADTDGTVSDKRSDRVADTRNHYCLILDDTTGAWTTALLSLSSTQIKKSKLLASMIASRKVKTAAGMVQAPAWSNVIRVTTVPESNDKGSWYGVRFSMVDGRLIKPSTEPDLYAAGKAFNQLVAKGAVQAKYEDLGDAPSNVAGGEQSDKF